MKNPLLTTIDPGLLKSEEQILLAAIRIFADYPPEVASVRIIAREAKVNYSAITYHFKTKENLYHEVLRRVSESVVQTYALPDTPLTPEAAKMELRAFFGRMADGLYSNPYAVSLAKIFLREHLSPSPIYDQLSTEVLKKVLDRMVDVILCLTGETDRRHASLQFFSMIGQVAGFRIQREILVRQLGFTGYSAVEIEELKTLIFKNIFRQLGVEP